MTDWTFKGFSDKILLYKGVFEMVETSKKKIAYDIGYQKENTITKTVRFGKNTEKELCEYIANLSEPFASLDVFNPITLRLNSQAK